jgi:hypothetical protein
VTYEYLLIKNFNDSELGVEKNRYTEITKELLQFIKLNFEGKSDKLDDFILDKRILTVQNALVKHLNSGQVRREVSGRVTSTLHKGVVYAAELQKAINTFFRRGGGSIDDPSKINSLTFSSYSTRIKLGESTQYNKGMADLIDPIRTPENANVNIINELNVCTFIGENGEFWIRCYDDSFEPITIPYIDYYDAFVVDDSSVDYVNKKFKSDKVVLKSRGQKLTISVDDLPMEYIIDASADEKLSYSTRNIPMLNYADSVRVAMG